MSDLAQRSCEACTGNTPRVTGDSLKDLLSKLNGWQVSGDEKNIRKAFEFKDFHHTMAFVNAVAWVAPSEDHHPTLEVSYKRCEVVYFTHAIGGLSENDFICAAKIDRLLSS
jgi:4a-hydroxytetrahydrobiopterin dehydratase